MALHSTGDQLNWHPHLHTIALNGAVLDDGSFLELPEVDTDILEQNFSEKVFTALLKKELLSQEVVDSMKRWEHSGFNVYAAEPIRADDEDARLFLSRYLKKAPLAESRLSIDETGVEPKVIYRSSTEDGALTRFFSPLEFLAELSLHIPNTWEQTTRMYGCYSSSTRGKVAREARYRALVRNNFKPIEEESEQRPTSASFARCMKRVFEINPLRCSRCGENMKIVAFILNSREIEKIANHLKYPTWRAPPSFARTGVHLDTNYEYSQSHS